MGYKRKKNLLRKYTSPPEDTRERQTPLPPSNNHFSSYLCSINEVIWLCKYFFRRLRRFKLNKSKLFWSSTVKILFLKKFTGHSVKLFYSLLQFLSHFQMECQPWVTNCFKQLKYVNTSIKSAYHQLCWLIIRTGGVKSHTSQGGPNGQSISRFLWHKATESIATPPWMGC